MSHDRNQWIARHIVLEHFVTNTAYEEKVNDDGSDNHTKNVEVENVPNLLLLCAISVVRKSVMADTSK